MGTVILGMSEERFWMSTPKKLIALWGMHKQANGFEAEEEKYTVEDVIF